MITIQIERNGFHYTQTIWRDTGKVKVPIKRDHAMEVVEENPNGRFTGSGEFDARQAHDWTWEADVEPEAV